MSEEDASGGEKTHDPTQKKLEDARKKGDIAKSTELAVTASYLALFIAFFAIGGQALQSSGAGLSVFLEQPDRLTGQILGPGGGLLSARLVWASVGSLSPLFIVPLAGALLAFVAQRAFVFSLEKLQPKLSRVSPIATAKQKFGPTGLVEFAKSTAKLIAISLIAGVLLWVEISAIVGSARATPAALSVTMSAMFMRLFTGILVVSAAIAFIDFAWQRFDHMRKLRMSFQDIKDENKEVEGDPHLKNRRRQRAVEISKNQMLADVPEADVVIVNPTHVSVALKWSRAKGTAPVCVAKGVDHVALQIREIADRSGVPLHRDVPTARALYDLVEIGDEIPPEQYKAVAAAIRFAEDMRRKARARGHHTGSAPE